MNYNTNDIVLYGSQGICSVSEITEQKIGTEIHKYYILRPLYDETSTVMVPVSNTILTARMRNIPTADDLNLYLNEAKEHISAADSDAARKEGFHNALDTSDIAQLLAITKQLYIARKQQEEKGKKLHVADERMLKESEKILFDCFAYVLNIHPKEAAVYIKNELNA